VGDPGPKEPSAEKSHQPKRAISRKEPSAEKSLQPKRAFSRKEPSAPKSLQLEIFKFKTVRFCGRGETFLSTDNPQVGRSAQQSVLNARVDEKLGKRRVAVFI